MMTSSKKLKQRSIYIHLPSTKMADDWKGRAQKHNLSISKFAIEHVLDSMESVQAEI